MRSKPSPEPRSSLWALIAFYLRAFREQHGQSTRRLGELTGDSAATVSRLETGKARLDETRAKTYDRVWDTRGLFQNLVWYASIGHDPQWWSQYVELEQRAGVIKMFEASLIPGLLQTEDYARAVIEAGGPLDAGKALQQRMERQAMLDRPHPPFLSVLLSQAALEWPIGSPEIMREQLARLLELSERSHVVIRVIPRTWDVGAYPGVDGSFRLMIGDDFGEVAYTESPGKGRLVSAPSEVQTYVIRYDRISAKALPEAPSRELIKKVLESFE
ncbi:helix-turn-helix domain-containing protein [Thermomonospora cellulosilytica]|uniref:Transcriptional regulator with XRE-family HTH domain n=1 Tax=Thermomonospora cellulosilytica TaxID=1411118 RepID=A0A7W3MVI0_9ACTN|nr:helix-turn-helix transcriptional regulator [Thermomonospora cellulosilytica]MBA9002650.1 transcriptional regulator with XRE-family HTH domain [Thermomonospora cellulosilytica]